MSLNVVNLVGRVGINPDVKYFESGTVKCTLTLAVNRPSSRTDEPDWFNLELWGKNAEFAANYVRKGRLISIQGSLKIETWKDRNTNVDRSKPVIQVSRIEGLGAKRDNDSNFGGSYQGGNDEF